MVTQEDEGFNWNKYIPNDGVALVAEVIDKTEEINMDEALEGWRRTRILVEAKMLGDMILSIFKTTSTSKNDEPEKKYVKGIIDVNQEMTTDYLTKIADQAMMADLKEVEIKKIESLESSQKVETMCDNVESEKVSKTESSNVK
ncbi:hypothetical protein Hanom_Chr05g00400871 [Helianthus anomalus]